MTEPLKCYRCGASLAALTLPLARRDECPDCLAELHVCRMCLHFDPQVSRQCREDDAEEVKDKTRANFCDYFVPNPGLQGDGYGQTEARARTQLDALFGDNQDSGDDDDDSQAAAAEDLFR